MHPLEARASRPLAHATQRRRRPQCLRPPMRILDGVRSRQRLTVHCRLLCPLKALRQRCQRLRPYIRAPYQTSELLPLQPDHQPARTPVHSMRSRFWLDIQSGIDFSQTTISASQTHGVVCLLCYIQRTVHYGESLCCAHTGRPDISLKPVRRSARLHRTCRYRRREKPGKTRGPLQEQLQCLCVYHAARRSGIDSSTPSSASCGLTLSRKRCAARLMLATKACRSGRAY